MACGLVMYLKTSGLRKMVAHAIAFESLVAKVYNILPPPVGDLDEVLAVLFTGPCKPTREELQRTPLLVQRKVVAHALEWLKLNHLDYADLTISYDELAKYPEDVPLVTVEFKQAQTNKVPEGTSTFDQAMDDRVEEGNCPFVVHGITGEQLSTKTVEALKGIALKHWNNCGAAISVGQSGTAQSIFYNLNLYPQIFPWLFPYGYGGIGTTKLSDKAHKKFLLMYHDKRFQTDTAFSFVAFSHEQIKATTKSFLIAEKSKFKDVAEHLLNVNQDVLADIAKRMSTGETVKPANHDEELCFQVIRDLDHVSAHVYGSITRKNICKMRYGR
jgi:hypothetical protein